MKLPSTCCGVLNLRQGSFVIGLVLLGLYSLSLLGCIVTWALLSAPQVPEPQLRQVVQQDDSVVTAVSNGGRSSTIFPVIFGPYLALALLHVLFSVLLVYGARVQRLCLLVTWLVYQGVTIIVGIVGAVVVFVLALHMSEYVLLAAVFGTLGGSVLMAYFFVVVLAFYRELRWPPATVVVRPPEPVQMVDIA